MKTILPVMLVYVLMIFPASAQSLSCPALKDTKTYAKEDDYQYMTDEGDGWLFRTRDYRADFKLNSAAHERFARLNAAMEKQGMKLVIALLPTRGIMHPGMQGRAEFDRAKAIASYQEIAKSIESTGISVARVTDFENQKNYFYKRDHHWTAAGAKDMAAKVAEKIKAMPAYAAIPKKKFKTETGETIDHMGTFAEFVQESCGTTIPPEKVLKHSTYEVGADDLTGDAQKADIILLGTSNSTDTASRANFDGFLKESIGADVENLSVSGGGVDSAVLNWLTSPDYASRKPKIVIWEFPIYHDYDSGPTQRQIIAGVHGDCASRAVKTVQKPISGENVVLFDDVSSLNMAGPDHYFRLKFSDMKERKFRASIQYANGKKISINFRRDKNDERHGIYFSEIEEKDKSPLKSLTLSMPSGVKGTVDATFCKTP